MRGARPRNRFQRFSFWLLLALAWSNAATGAEPAHPTPPLAQLLALIDARLELMRDVALYKFRSAAPIAAPARERRVIDAAVDAASRAGLDPETTARFFDAQISAAKAVQQGWITQWGRTPPSPSERAPDLATELRPQLLALGEALVVALAGAEPTLREAALVDAHRSQFNSSVAVEHLTAPAANSLFDAMLAVRANRSAQTVNVLHAVLARGYLRVGTTGDYPPFSHWDASAGRFVGIDIAMSEKLAQSLNVEVRHVRTSWPALMADLTAGRFDIAMSGVTHTLERQRQGLFSGAYHLGGKTPIVRCTDVDRFSGMDRIDQPGVRVVVNPGGTNEVFTRRHIQSASIRIHPDNTTIFSELVRGAADVMFTDDIEVRLQSRLRPRLCPAMPDHTLTKTQKAYLLPTDLLWKAYVDAWLEEQRLSGALERDFEEGLEKAATLR